MSDAILPGLVDRGCAAGDAVREGAGDTAALAAHLVTDTLACMTIGRSHPTVRRLAEVQPMLRGGLDRLVAETTAAHVDELDVVHPRSGTVPGAVVVPPALRVGEACGVPSERFLGAVVAGVEVTAQAGLVLGGAQLYSQSWWPAAVAGRLGAAMAAAYILGLDPPQVRNALSLAATSVGGLLSEDVFGDAHYVLLGDATACGVQAAYRAAAGLRGSSTLLDGPARRAFAGVQPLAGSEGPEVHGAMPKEFPCATPLQAVIHALRTLGGAALMERASTIEVALPAAMFAFVSADRVVDGPPEAAASLAYVVGAVARRREHDVDFFRAADPESLADCELTLRPSEREGLVNVVVTTVDGERHSCRQPLRGTDRYEQVLDRKLDAAFGPENGWTSLPGEVASGLSPRSLGLRLQQLQELEGRDGKEQQRDHRPTLAPRRRRSPNC
jgi:2-methylcitrate dehydratase PrpD